MPVLYAPELDVALVGGWALLDFLLHAQLPRWATVQRYHTEGGQSLRGRPGFLSKGMRDLLYRHDIT